MLHRHVGIPGPFPIPPFGGSFPHPHAAILGPFPIPGTHSGATAHPMGPPYSPNPMWPFWPNSPKDLWARMDSEASHWAWAQPRQLSGGRPSRETGPRVDVRVVTGRALGYRTGAICEAGLRCMMSCSMLTSRLPLSSLRSASSCSDA